MTPVLLDPNLAIKDWLLYAQWIYVLSRPNLLADNFPHWYKDSVGLRVTLAPVAATLTTLICFWSVTTSLAVYVLILPVYFVPLKRKNAPPRESNSGATKARITPRRLLILGGALVSVVEWLLFRPELLVVNHRVSEGLSTDQAHKFLSGEFKGLAHETNGKAGIYDIGGRKVLRFTNFSTSNGPDVHVYLVASPNASDDNAARQPASSILAA